MEDVRVMCHYCQRTDSDLKRCGRCYNVYYCSKGCQAMDYPRHKCCCVSTTRKHNTYKTKLKVKRTTEHETKCDEIQDNEKGYENKDQTTENTGTDEGNEKMDMVFDGTTGTEMKTECTLGSHYFKSGLNGNRTTATIESTGHNSSDSSEKQPGKGSVSSIGETAKNSAETKLPSSNSKEKMDGTERNICTSCSVARCFQKCSRCKEAFYCSRRCQRQDWANHKKKCKQKLSEEDERILASIKKRHDDVARCKKRQEDSKSTHFTEVYNFMGPGDRIEKTLTPEIALKKASRPHGSLGKAVRMARMFFPHHDIVTEFDGVPWERASSSVIPLRDRYVLVAFMYRYHEHVMRHGVYLKDALDKDSKVEFYLDHVGDNPFPFFRYSQVKPGGYICLVGPVMHLFIDGSVGIRINNPNEVKVLDIEMVMK